jgi:hypothetical protein
MAPSIGSRGTGRRFAAAAFGFVFVLVFEVRRADCFFFALAMRPPQSEK